MDLLSPQSPNPQRPATIDELPESDRPCMVDSRPDHNPADGDGDGDVAVEYSEKAVTVDFQRADSILSEPSVSLNKDEGLKIVDAECNTPRKAMGEPNSPDPAQTSSEAMEPNIPDPEQALSEAKHDQEPRTGAQESESLCVQLAQLAQRRRDEELRCHSLKSQERLLLMSSGHSVRLIRSMELAYRTLVEYYRNDDKDQFSSLHNDILKLRMFCKIPAWRDIHPRNTDARIGSNPFTTGVSHQSWMSRLPHGFQKHLLALLTRIRTEPDYLSGRIASLSSSDLSSFILPYQCLEANESVINVNQLDKDRKLRNHRPARGGVSRLNHLRQFHRRDPLSFLLYAVFDDSSEFGSSEDILRSDVWSSICARLITEGKRGSDQFLVTILNLWASLRAWPLRPHLEPFLAKLLSDGAFLLEPVQSRTTFNIPLESQNVKPMETASSFFDRTLSNLFKIIDSSSLTAIFPDGVLELACAILGKLETPELQTKARNFIFSSWFISSFLSRAICYPESHGLLMDHHITNGTRQHLLKEVAIRLQKQVSDVVSPWKFIAPATSESRRTVEAILQYFKPIDYKDSVSSVSRMERSKPGLPYLVISPAELRAVIQALFPEARPSSSALSEPSFRGADSCASSVTASSKITSAGSDIESRVTSSTALSIGGSSITDHSTLQADPSNESRSTLTVSQEHETDEPRAYRYDTLAAGGDFGLGLRALCEQLPDVAVDGLSNSFESSFEDRAYIFISDGGTKLSLEPLDDCSDDLAHGDLSRDSAVGATENLTSVDRDLLKQAVMRVVEHENVSRNITSLSRHFNNNLSMSPSFNPGLSKLESQTSPLVADGLPNHGNTNSFLGEPHRILDREKHLSHKSILGLMLQSELDRSRSEGQFQSAHFWWRSLRALGSAFASTSPRIEAQLLESFIKELQDDIRTISKVTQQSTDILVYLESVKEKQDTSLQFLENEVKALRDQMWYTSTVKHSSKYEELRNVTLALRAMARPIPDKQRTSGISSWARQRLARNPPGFDTAEAQALERLTAHKDHGGPMKLADKQVELISGWMTRQSIENFCKGEERIHRFCFEVQKCANKLTKETMLESPELWSSPLYAHEKETLENKYRRPSPFQTHLNPDVRVDSGYTGRRTTGLSLSPLEPQSGVSTLQRVSPERNDQARLLRYDSKGICDAPSTQNTLYLDATNHSPPINSWSSFGRSIPLPISEASRNDRALFLGELKKMLICLLISDLGDPTWQEGSETDLWMFDETTPSGNFSEMRSYNVQPNISPVSQDKAKIDGVSDLFRPPDVLTLGTSSRVSHVMSSDTLRADASKNLPDSLHVHHTDATGPSTDYIDGIGFPFPFREAYSQLTAKFSSMTDPHQKLQSLYELELLIISSLTDKEAVTPRVTVDSSRTPLRRTIRSRSIGIPRTKATRLEEVMANCEERRAITLRDGKSPDIHYWRHTAFNDDEIVTEFFSIFVDPKCRPKALFRDLQYIAAFVPASILDNTPQGEAFWNAGLAALALKEDHCKSKIEMADRIVAYHLSPKNSASQETRSGQLGSPPSTDSVPVTSKYPTSTEDLSHYPLSVAATMYTIAAKEGFPAAARELGLFYLTHPELLQPRITLLPLSKPSDVFKSLVINREKRSEGGVAERLDPLIFSVSFHWMEVAANGGDRDARDFLKENSELGTGR